MSECDITFEWYRSYIHSYVHTCSFIYSRRFLTAAIANSCVGCWLATELCLKEEQRQRKYQKLLASNSNFTVLLLKEIYLYVQNSSTSSLLRIRKVCKNTYILLEKIPWCTVSEIIV